MHRTNLTIYQGDDYAAVVTVRNADGTPADISTYTAEAQIRRAAADVDEVVVATFTAVVASPAVNLTLTHDQTLPLTGSYVWDLQLVSAGGVITTIMAGQVRMTAEVTRAA
jgi:hypothetical protein